MEVSIDNIYWPAMKFLLAATSPVTVPVQNLLTKNCVTHNFCNHQAIEILYNDDKKTSARMTEKYLDSFNKGADWADSFGKNLSHFFIPQLRSGISKFSNAAWECHLYFQKALKKWQKGQPEKAFFYLGTAVHLVQDLCVPHHAKGILLDGHQEYENWAETNRAQYLICSQGNYNIGATIDAWVLHNATIAEKLYDHVRHGSTDQSYDTASQVLLPQAQRSTAGFIDFFLTQAVHI